MKTKIYKATCKATALLSAAVMTAQVALPEAVLYAHAENASSDGYEINQNVTSSWDGGCCAEIVLTNLQQADTETWKLTFRSADQITNLWGGMLTETVQMEDVYEYTVEAFDYNRVISAGGRVSIGYVAQGNDHAIFNDRAELIFLNGIIEQTPTEENTLAEIFPGSLTTYDGLVIPDDNEYYDDLMLMIATTQKIPEVRGDKETGNWEPLTQLTHSNGETDIRIEFSPDVILDPNLTEVEEGYGHRIIGTVNGQKIERYVAYGEELKAIYNAMNQAKREQLQELIDTGFDAFYIYQLDKNTALLSTDDLGQVTLITDLDAFGKQPGNVAVHVSGFRFATDDEITTDNGGAPQIVGTMEIIK